jgi:hypothetical protein
MAINYWKVYCNERDSPGLWKRWFKAQCVAVGWPPGSGFRLEGKTNIAGSWRSVRETLKSIKAGDSVLAQLPHNRVGRIGTVTRALKGDSWYPLVQERKDLPYGEIGRRIEVRWDMDNGPEDSNTVVGLPEEARLSPGQVRKTIQKLDALTFNRIASAIRDEINWVALGSEFVHERFLSDFIGTVPQHLGDGLQPYPWDKIREKVFVDGTRSDVLLEDEKGRPVVVECKNGALTSSNVEQLIRYLKHAEKETGRKPRGILVYGGARSLSKDVKRALRKNGKWPIEVMQYEMSVRFSAGR